MAFKVARVHRFVLHLSWFKDLRIPVLLFPNREQMYDYAVRELGENKADQNYRALCAGNHDTKEIRVLLSAPDTDLAVITHEMVHAAFYCAKFYRHIFTKPRWERILLDDFRSEEGGKYVDPEEDMAYIVADLTTQTVRKVEHLWR